ncbi:hypothetical protein OROHE_010541 [Orobanche hederae]
MIGAAMDVFGIMEENGYMPDVDNINALLLWLRKCGRTDLSMEVFEMIMIRNGHMPNETTYTTIVEGIILEEKELGMAVLKQLYARRGCEPDDNEKSSNAA